MSFLCIYLLKLSPQVYYVKLFTVDVILVLLYSSGKVTTQGVVVIVWQVCVQIIPEHTGEWMTKIGEQMTKVLQKNLGKSLYFIECQ